MALRKAGLVAEGDSCQRMQIQNTRAVASHQSQRTKRTPSPPLALGRNDLSKLLPQFLAVDPSLVSVLQNHLIHYRSEYRPLQNPLWDISVPTMNKFMRKYCDIIEKINIEPKLVVKLQPFGTERVIFPLINTSDALSKLLNSRKLVFSY